MDVLVSSALQEVAAEGSQGCPLPTLWNALLSPALAAGLPLDAPVKQAVWTTLLATPCMTLRGPVSGPLPCTEPSVQVHGDAENLGILAVGSEELRESYLGIYDYKHCDSRLSAEQRMVLERIGQARATGVTQFQLGKEFGMNGKKLFYIIKNLESRGLIVRQSSIFRAERPVATNLVHLRQFAKNVQLGSQQRFEIHTITKVCPEQMANMESLSQEGGSKDLLINDDLPALKEICKRLEEAENKVLVVSDLKVSLGYRFKTGHRKWRRVLSRLTAAGLVEAFDAKIAHKVLHCIRLIKSFDLKALSCKYSNASNEENSPNQSFKAAKRGQVTDQVAELPLNRQIYDYIKQGGSDGVTVTEIFTNLGLNNRQNYFRLTELASKHGLRLEAENYKRSTQYRVWTPVNARDDSEHVSPGWTLQRGAKTSSNHDRTEVPHKLRKQERESEPWKVQADLRGPSCVKATDAAEDETLVTGLEVVPYKDDQTYQEKSGQVDVSSDTVEPPNKQPISTESLPVSFSRSTQRLTPLSSRHTQREVWIMERLERDRFILRAELHKWLEEMEGRTDILLDRKTVVRNVQKLQHEGRCKCLLVSLPGVTNYGQFRTVEVVLLPSLEVSPQVLGEIYESQRAFDMLIRSQRSMANKKSKVGVDIPDLTGLKRMEAQIVDKGGTLHDNGFVYAKMIRSRMLHRFLWGYVADISGANDVQEGGGMATSSGDGIFSLLVAIQAMPLELFLQVIGSTKHIKGLAERCRRGMRLSDLPTRESEALLDANASGRLSWLVDILRRLKLLRIVMIPTTIEERTGTTQQAGVAYCLEQRPYLDEPAPEPPSSLSAHVIQLGPSPRHCFHLSSKESLEDYWRSLEYFFCAGHSSMARRVFPGSTVPELFGPRSWASMRVMSLDQRTELQRRIGVNDSRRLPYKECVRIARELNLSLDQVLRASYEKNQKVKLQEACKSLDDGNINIAVGHKALRSQLKRHLSSSEGVLASATSLEISKKQHLSSEQNALESTPDVGSRDGSGRKLENKEVHVEGDECREDLDSGFAGGHVKIVKRPLRGKRFHWNSSYDRVLVACYTRQRALLGARYNRVDWNQIQGLPATPETCRRRICILKMIPTVRKALMVLCNILAARYTKSLRSQFLNKYPWVHNREDLEGTETTETSFGGFRWDDFDDPSLSAPVDAIIRSKQLLRGSSAKKKGESKYAHRRNLKGDACLSPSTLAELNQAENADDLGALGSEITTYDSMSSYLVAETSLQALNKPISGDSMGGQPSPNLKHMGGIRARPNRVQPTKKLQRPLMLKDMSGSETLQKSMGAAMAVELIKLVFLNSTMETEVSQVLVEALRRCKESDIFTAFRFLKDQNMVAVEHESRAFVLSPKFYESSATSTFSKSTCEESFRFQTWLREQSANLEKDWVRLNPEKEWGELLLLFGTMLMGEISILPFMPDKGIGEQDQGKKRKRDVSGNEEASFSVKKKAGVAIEEGGFSQRRERGFPGIEVKAHSIALPLQKMLEFDIAKDLCLEYEGNVPTLVETSTLAVTDEESLLAEGSAMTRDAMLSSVSGHGDPGLGDLAKPLQMVEDEFLNVVYEAVLAAGEDGLRIDELPGLVGSDGKSKVNAEDAAQALYSFGLAREVMAYDHYRIVSNRHSQQWFLHLPSTGGSSLACTSAAKESFDNALVSIESSELTDGVRVYKTTLTNKESEVSNEEQTPSLQHKLELMDIDKDRDVEFVPVLPWLAANGKENAVLRKALNRKVMGIIMLNPGIMEESIIEHLDVLNPTSCQRLLELLVLEGHLFVRMQMKAEVVAPLLMEKITRHKPGNVMPTKHYFANPLSITLL